MLQNASLCEHITITFFSASYKGLSSIEAQFAKLLHTFSNAAATTVKMGCLQSLDWTSGVDWWTELVD